MDLRDTVSRILLGIAFGFVMGIVMYQAAGVDAGVTDKNFLYADPPPPPPPPPTVGVCEAPNCFENCGAPGGPAQCACLGMPPECDPFGPCPGSQALCNGTCCLAGVACVNNQCADCPGVMCGGSGDDEGVCCPDEAACVNGECLPGPVSSSAGNGLCCNMATNPPSCM